MSEENTTTPPWGKDEDFDPAKAWSLIQNLRTDKDGLKAQLDTVTAEKDAEITRLTGELTETTTSLDAATTKVTSLETSLGEKDGTLTQKDAVIKKQQLLSDAGLPLKYVAQVVGDDDKAWTESVKSLQELRGTSAPQRVADPVQVADQQNGDPRPSEEEVARRILGV